MFPFGGCGHAVTMLFNGEIIGAVRFNFRRLLYPTATLIAALRGRATAKAHLFLALLTIHMFTVDFVLNLCRNYHNSIKVINNYVHICRQFRLLRMSIL